MNIFYFIKLIGHRLLFALYNIDHFHLQKNKTETETENFLRNATTFAHTVHGLNDK